MRRIKQLPYYIFDGIFIASVFSCRPRYLRCGKKRYCDTNKVHEVIPEETISSDFATCK